MTTTEVEVNAQGRVTIPKALREKLGIHGGSRLVAREENGRLVFEDRVRMLHHLQGRMRTLRSVNATLASDELITERRAEAARELGEEPPA